MYVNKEIQNMDLYPRTFVYWIKVENLEGRTMVTMTTYLQMTDDFDFGRNVHTQWDPLDENV